MIQRIIRLHPFITSVLEGGRGVQEILTANTKEKNSSYENSEKKLKKTLT